MAFKDLLDRFKKGLSRTARLFDVRAWLGRKVDQDFLDKLEATLIQADVGVVATRKVDVLIVDTAGRLHTQSHLMRELEKVRQVIARKIPGAPHEVLLVLDSTNGQNAIRQAEVFTKSIGCTGVILTKLDGTAKGGVVVAVRQYLKLPVQVIRVGQGNERPQP